MPTKSEAKFTFNTAGSLNTLGSIVKGYKVDIDPMDMMNVLQKYLKTLEPDEERMFKAFFYRQMTITEIYKTYNYKSEEYVESTVRGVMMKFISSLKKDFGTKQ